MLRYLTAALMAVAIPGVASATTECTSQVSRIWAGDGGYVWVFFSAGGAAAINPNDPSKKAALALATTAMATGRTVTVRYSGNGVICTATNFDFVGLYLDAPNP
ncbi:MAG: hypothetical protein JF570_04555 [Caulobacter sp.]|nr:hypothetical protein [Caulobacter sp.]MBW8890982.1 hypothetical protein [Burkholderiales bacterium]